MKQECYLKNHNKELCTGCRNCELICPKKCISMCEDSEGFFYPFINKQKCINCGKCVRHCPVASKYTNNNLLKEEKAYGYCTKKKDDLLNASSGGAFLDLVKEFCKNKKNNVIFGVKFDKNFKVITDYVTSVEKVHIFRKSKYVQSNVQDAYNKVKTFLLKDYNVFFSGTPCQIAALKSFLNKEYSNLLCIDIICHGVPSQKIFDMYLDIEKKRHKSNIKNINFREKIKDKSTNKFNSRNIKISFQNNENIVENRDTNIFLKGFHNALFYRPSCYHCKFASTNRISDITIADCWGIENLDNKIDVHKGFSCIIVHTKKGERLFNKINKSTVKKLTLDFVIENNAQYSKPAKKNKYRKRFFKNLTENNFENKVKKYTKNTLTKRAKRKIRFILNKYV